MSTATDLKNSIVNYGGDEVSEIGDSPGQFLEWLNQALVNSHDSVCNLFNKWATDSFTFTVKGYENNVPADWDGICDMVLYTDSSYTSPYDNVSVKFGVHRFDGEQPATKTFYRRYRTQPSVYLEMTDTVDEIANPRLKKIIMDEVIAMYLSAQNDLESGNAEQASLSKSNRNS